ncbi:lytic murein transglycosylase [Saccharopolyspora gloriosae]|uniref:lytic murein transglycosylase n=1 Tax=Saccharopolyspora gloriosae TaxID=455344 RepID=UPI001FB7FEAD|nr:lytic murein transglycosylase [Saccharopolyspora gloriosae]
MSQQLSTRRPWRLAGVVPMIALLVSCAPEPTTRQQNQPSVQAEPPTAVAPPDGGVAPSPLTVLPAGTPPLPTTERPQLQLEAWSESMSDELNIPRAALQAYGYAARAAETSHPGCGLGWTTLAGIGAIESSHGRFNGARLDETGRPSIPIIGLPLDGSHGVKRIEDTDGGLLDGDPVFDRAIGPLQFIPTTWERWASDADGDGVADPHDIDDAALAAAQYLCTVGGDMNDPDRFWVALLDYNESHDYGQDVLNYADHYGKTSRTLGAEGGR